MKKFLAFVVLAALAIGAFFLSRGLKTVPPEKAWREYAVRDVASIAFSGSGGEFSLEPRGKNWVVRMPGRQEEPLADTARITELLVFLANNRPLLHVGEPGVENTGLDGTGPAVAINGLDRLDLGRADPSGVGVYARRSRVEGVVLLAREYTDVLTRGMTAYCDLRLLDLEPEKVQGVTVVRGDETWEIVREGGLPVFAQPAALIPRRVRAEVFNLWLHELVGLKASAPAAEPPAPDSKPDIVVSLRLKGGDSGKNTLSLYAPTGGSGPWLAVSSRQPVHFLLDPERAIKVDKNAFSLMDRRLAALDPGAVDRLVLSASDRRLRAVRDGKRWKNEGQPATMTGIDMLLWRLTDLQYEYGPVGVLPATAEERMRLELSSKGGSTVQELVFYVDSGLPSGQCWASSSGGQGFYPVADQIFKDLRGLLPPAPEGAAKP